jgi:long-chain-fatty-acid--CoA ligase ACSBG
MIDGKEVSYTWGEYFDQAFNFAKAITKMGTEERKAVAVMGFNSPEWMFAFVGGILNN